MTLTASLQDFNLFSIFNIIKSQNKIGALEIVNGDARVKIYFDNSNVIGVYSNQRDSEDDLGSILLRFNKISHEEMQSIFFQQNHDLRYIEKIILESGTITLKDLQDVLHIQAMKVIHKIFLWTSGNYQFNSIITDSLESNNFPPIPIEAILMEAANLLDEWPHVQKRLPDRFQALARSAVADDFIRAINRDISKDITVILDGNALAQFNSMNLTFDEEIVLQYFDQPHSIDSVVKNSKFYELDTCKHIANLLEKGLLEIYEQQSITDSAITRQIADIQKKQAEISYSPSVLLWPLAAIFVIIPLSQYSPKTKLGINRGLVSISCQNTKHIQDKQTEERSALVSILHNVKSDKECLVIPAEPSENPFINSEAAKLFSQYHSDPLLSLRSNSYSVTN